MRIFVMGQTSVHWGRKEFGNIGNYYVTESFFRLVHETFPNSEIYTTIQLTEEFCARENVTCVPLELYYNWSDTDLSTALKEYAIAELFCKTGILVDSTPYIQEVLKSDLIIDHSGDMWGENADLAGKNRFLIGLLKDRTAQLLGKTTVLLGGSPGPFDAKFDSLTRETLKEFDLVTTRDGLSKVLLENAGFETDNVEEFACPSYFFKGDPFEELEQKLEGTPLFNKTQPVVGINICGWNMEDAPFSKWPRDDREYEKFVDLIEYITHDLQLNVCLLSHSNGFLKDPEFKLIHGRDFPIVEQLYNLVQKKGKNPRLFLLDGVYSPGETKSIISKFDLFISGRLHGAVAALSQMVPTIIVDYGHEPKAHKLKGFARQIGLENCVVDPADINGMTEKVREYWNNREVLRAHLEKEIPLIKEKARQGFYRMRELF